MGIHKGRADIKACGEEMRLTRVLVFAAFVGTFAAGCYRAPETTKAVTGQNANAAPVLSAPANPAGQNTVVNAESNSKIVNKRVRGNEALVDADPSGTPLPPQFQPVAENSSWAVTMNPDGSVLEMRVFKSNPQLAKVEATSRGSNEKQVKFYLRSGQVVEVKTDRLGNLKTMTAAELLALADVK